jgi:hypothetical protein
MTSPGIHTDFNLEIYTPEEVNIIRKLAREWYVTSSTFPVRVGRTATYRAFLMKATDIYGEMFNLEREIVAIFSSYSTFDTRSLNAFDEATKRWPPLRTDNVCRFLMSKDNQILARVDGLLKSEPELPLIVPFSYDELHQSTDKFFIRNRMRKYFYTRDLFAFENPLKKDLYFFGRNQIVQELLNRHRSGENSALFGLRRSGKTSIVLGIERAAKLHNDVVIRIDCQSPSIHKRRWNELLVYLVSETRKAHNVAAGKLLAPEKYTEVNAADAFATDVKRLKTQLKRPILFIFDEIERIAFNTGSSAHWKAGDDFLFFWQAVRSAFQRQEKTFTFLMVGTNARGVETPFINGQDNPIFNSVRVDYIPPFTVDDTRDMMRTLGLFMGLKFDEAIYARINDDLGGHPYLIRHLCSLIHREARGSRPLEVDRTVYDSARQRFTERYISYTEQVLEALKADYPDEMAMLVALANNDHDTFNVYADDWNYTNHLQGYGIVARGANAFYFRNEIIKQHILRLDRYAKKNMTPDEVAAEIAERRRVIERKLRRSISKALKFRFGANANEAARKCLRGATLAQFEKVGLEHAFAPDSIVLNLSDLFNIIEQNWDVFSIVTQCKLEDFKYHYTKVLDMRKGEAHSRSEENYDQLRPSFEFMEAVAQNIE